MKKKSSKEILTFELPADLEKIEDCTAQYDAKNQAAVEQARVRIHAIEKRLATEHSKTGLTNKTAKDLAAEKKTLESFVRSYS
jgi:hypothetical protein